MKPVGDGWLAVFVRDYRQNEKGGEEIEWEMETFRLEIGV